MKRGVCIVTQPERRGTGKSHAMDLAEIIGELTSVSIMTGNLGPDSPMRHSYEIIEYSHRGAGDAIVIEAIRFLLNQFRISLAIRRRPESTIIFFGTTAYLLPVIVSRLLRKRVAILPRGNVPLSLKLRWERQVPAVIAWLLAGSVWLLQRATFASAHGIITYTPSMARQLGLDPDNASVYPDGARFVDHERFTVSKSYPERADTVGYFGRFAVEKRLPMVVEAAASLDDVAFLFVGDGEYREALETELADGIDTGRVEVPGWVSRDDLPELYNRCKLVIVPSHPTEGLPTVILEAFSCGTPVLAAPISGVPDVVVEGVTGTHLSDRSAVTVAEQIESMLDDDEQLANMHENCRHMIEKGFTKSAAVERYRVILEAL